MTRQYFVYILASKSRVLYADVTNNLQRRVSEHGAKIIKGFTARYNVSRLVHYETTSDVRVALAREKEIKGWRRQKKLTLIEADNPRWEDLSEAWTVPEEPSGREVEE